MTWTKLGDEYGDQCWKLSDAAMRLHTEALVWSNRRHIDGRLDKDEMRQWAKRPEAATELVAYGWWSDEGDHYLIVYHLGWQRTAEEWLKQSEVNKANRAKGKARPVKRKPINESSDESSDERTDERDRTGQDRKEAFKGSETPKTGNGTGPAECRYCGTELPAHMASQRMRGYCHRADCQAEAKAELS
jgi:hypothetical protein